MTNYPSNVSDSQWAIISKKIETSRNRKYKLREIWNAISYLVKTSCQWRSLPSDFPSWRIVYYYFSIWSKSGIIQIIHDYLVKSHRKKSGRKSQPSVGIIDAQSVKNTLISSQQRGYDAGKKIKGIKRHMIVDTQGHILAIQIQSASVQDRDGATEVVEKMYDSWKKIKKLYADGGYRGKLIPAVKEKFNIEMEIVKTKDLPTFKVLPKRWIIERTFAWLETNRRIAKNFERLSISSVSVALIAAIRRMLAHF
jgi:putative transposase